MNYNIQNSNIKLILILIVLIILLILIYRIYNFPIFETFNTVKVNNEPKIAFLFLTYNNLKRPDIWNKFYGIDINNNSSGSNSINNSEYANKFTIYNHAKEPENVTDVLLKDKHIPEHIETCWGCPNLVEANLLMMKEALKDPLNTKFILVSDSCIPIVSFDNFYNEIMKDDKTIINIHYNNNPERYDNIINPSFKKDEFTKHSGSGLVLNVKHANLLVADLDNYRNNWKDVFVPDEHYIGNILRVLDNNFNINYKNNKTTFDIWSNDILDKTKFYNNDVKSDIITDGYINISKITNKAIDEIRDKKFLLIRKVNETTEIDINYINK